MAQHREKVRGGFLTDPGEVSGGRVFVLNAPWKSAFSDIFERDGIIGIRVADASQQTEVGFLADLPPLKYIDVYAWGVKDLSAIECHPSVEHLGLECQFKNVDFSKFFALRELLTRWRPGIDTAFESPHLTYLSLDGYPYQDLTPLIRLKNLNRLCLESKNLERFDGIGELPNLQDVSCIRCPQLVDISAIQSLGKLKSAMFFSCKKITSLSPFDGMKVLERLHFENGVAVDSVKHLVQCDNLREVFLIGMSVVDGDLSPFLDMPRLEKIAIAKKSNHSHTMQEVNAALQNK